MSVTYDQYYKAPNLFGDPFPILLHFFDNQPVKGKVLDLGCGQGRDAIALARMGYEVDGIDHSAVGIEQMNQVAASEDLKLTGHVKDIYTFRDYKSYDFILLDSMFHFAKKDRRREIGLIQTIYDEVKAGCIMVFCVQDTKDKVNTLFQALDARGPIERISQETFEYVFKDGESGHTSETPYHMIVVKKTE